MKFFVSSGSVTRLLGVALGLAVIVSAATRWGPGVRADDKAAAPGVLTDDIIRAWLTNLAYEFKEEKTKTGSNFAVTIDREGWKIRSNVSLSSSGGYFWDTVYCQLLPKDKKLTAGHLRALLEANDTPVGAFSVDPSDGMILLAKVTENRGFTPVAFRKLIEDMDTMLRRTEALWDASSWKDTPAAAPGGAEAKDAAPKSMSRKVAAPSRPVRNN